MLKPGMNGFEKDFFTQKIEMYSLHVDPNKPDLSKKIFNRFIIHIYYMEEKGNVY